MNMTAPIGNAVSYDFTSNNVEVGSIIRGDVPVTSMSFHEDGKHLFIAYGDDLNVVKLIDCYTGKETQHATRNMANGIRLVEATHHEYSILTAGEGKNKDNNNKVRPTSSNASSTYYDIVYTSVWDNQALGIFRGHTGKINNICMNPMDDSFLTSSYDRTVRLWNLQQSAAIGQMTLPTEAYGSPLASYDASGMLMGITASMEHSKGNMIHLYDAKKYDAGPFSELKVLQSDVEIFLRDKCYQTPQEARDLSKAEWKSLEFDSGGKLMLITTHHGLALTLDGFTAEIQHAFVAPKTKASTTTATGTTAAGDTTGNSVDPEAFTTDDEPGGGGTAASAPATNTDGVINSLETCFSPDDRFVVGGCADGTIQCWDVSTGTLVKQLNQANHAGPISSIKFNPKLAMMASSCTNTALWIW